ncbi:hypothetical protein C8R45DRAFT_933444 [Mycena sanguinolenta]|nr:hypothetical protein C8R45DRAFT_933444 [Mycena sanguinolenta]
MFAVPFPSRLFFGAEALTGRHRPRKRAAVPPVNTATACIPTPQNQLRADWNRSGQVSTYGVFTGVEKEAWKQVLASEKHRRNSSRSEGEESEERRKKDDESLTTANWSRDTYRVRN